MSSQSRLAVSRLLTRGISIISFRCGTLIKKFALGLSPGACCHTPIVHATFPFPSFSGALGMRLRARLNAKDRVAEEGSLPR